MTWLVPFIIFTARFFALFCATAFSHFHIFVRPNFQFLLCSHNSAFSTQHVTLHHFTFYFVLSQTRPVDVKTTSFDLFLISFWSLFHLFLISFWSLFDLFLISFWSLLDLFLISFWSLFHLFLISFWSLFDLFLISFWSLFDLFLISFWIVTSLRNPLVWNNLWEVKVSRDTFHFPLNPNFLFSVFRLVQGEAKTPKVMGCCRANFCIFTCNKDWHFSWKMNIRMSDQNLTFLSPGSLFF